MISGSHAREVRVHEQQLERRVRVQAEQRLQQAEDGGGRPGLGRAGLGIEGRERVVLVARVAREDLRQAVEIEEPRRLELRPAEPLHARGGRTAGADGEAACSTGQTSRGGSCRGCTRGGGESVRTPSPRTCPREQRRRAGTRCLVEDARGHAVTAVRADGADLAGPARPGPWPGTFVVHPEGVGEPLLQLGRLAGRAPWPGPCPPATRAAPRGAWPRGRRPAPRRPRWAAPPGEPSS